MTAYDWTKLDDGWVRVDDRPGIKKAVSATYEVYVDDDGDVFVTEDNSPERTFGLLAEAMVQRRKCEVHKPRFATGDKVTHGNYGPVYTVIDAPILRGGSTWYPLYSRDPLDLLQAHELALVSVDNSESASPKFKLGDWVRTDDGRVWRIVSERGRGMYLLLVRDGVTLQWNNEYALEAVE